MFSLIQCLQESGQIPISYALKVFLKSKYTQINRISLVNKYFQYGLLKVSGKKKPLLEKLFLFFFF